MQASTLTTRAKVTSSTRRLAAARGALRPDLHAPPLTTPNRNGRGGHVAREALQARVHLLGPQTRRHRPRDEIRDALPGGPAIQCRP